MHDFFCRLFNRNCAEDNIRHIEVIEYPNDGPVIVAPIPEPSSIILSIAGAMVVGHFIRRKHDIS